MTNENKVIKDAQKALADLTSLYEQKNEQYGKDEEVLANLAAEEQQLKNQLESFVESGDEAGFAAALGKIDYLNRRKTLLNGNSGRRMTPDLKAAVQTAVDAYNALEKLMDDKAEEVIGQYFEWYESIMNLWQELRHRVIAAERENPGDPSSTRDIVRMPHLCDRDPFGAEFTVRRVAGMLKMRKTVEKLSRQ